MQKPWLDNPDVKRLDPIWTQVRREAEETSTREPVLASLIYATILSEPTFEDAVCHRLAQRLEHSVDAGLCTRPSMRCSRPSLASATCSAPISWPSPSAILPAGV